MVAEFSEILSRTEAELDEARADLAAAEARVEEHAEAARAASDRAAAAESRADAAEALLEQAVSRLAYDRALECVWELTDPGLDPDVIVGCYRDVLEHAEAHYAERMRVLPSYASVRPVPVPGPYVWDLDPGGAEAVLAQGTP